MAWRNVYLPHLTVKLPALEQGAWLSEVSVYQAERAHQVVELTVMHTRNPNFPSQQWRTPAGSVWAENQPVHLQYGWYADDSADWYGYVASSRVVASETDPKYGHAVQVPVVYTLVGTSMLMQTRRNKTWRGTTASAIARQIATSYNFQPRVDGTTTVMEQSTQAASDWQYLCDLAERIGYRLFVDNSTLWFVRRPTVMQAADGSVPVFWQRKAPGVIDSLRQFSAVVGDTDPSGGLRAQYETVAYNRSTGILTPATYAQNRTTAQGQEITPLLTHQFSQRPTSSYAQAEQSLGAQADWLWVEANATTNGDPRLKPGSLVELRGNGIGDANEGVWMVRSAIHKLCMNHVYPQNSSYTTTLVVGRNNARSLDLGVQDRPLTPAPTVLISGKWRAAYTGGAS